MDEESKLNSKYLDLINYQINTINNQTHKLQLIKVFTSVYGQAEVDLESFNLIALNIINCGQEVVCLYSITKEETQQLIAETWNINSSSQEIINAVCLEQTRRNDKYYEWIGWFWITQDGRIIFANEKQIKEFNVKTGKKLYYRNKWLEKQVHEGQYKLFVDSMAMSLDETFLLVGQSASLNTFNGDVIDVLGGNLLVWDLINRKTKKVLRGDGCYESSDFSQQCIGYDSIYLTDNDEALVENPSNLFLLSLEDTCVDFPLIVLELEDIEDKRNSLIVTPYGKKIIVNDRVYDWNHNYRLIPKDNYISLENYNNNLGEDIMFASDEFLVVADKDLIVWNLDNGKIVDKFTGKYNFCCGAITLDSKLIIAGNEQGQIHLFQLS